MRGRLAIDRLRQAVKTVVDLHDALRTTITADGQDQMVVSRLDFAVPFLDFSPIEDSSWDSDQALHQWLLDQSQTPFDLHQGPPIRVTLIKLAPTKLAPERHALNLCTHHIVSDGWSLAVILAEICQLYSGNLDLPTVQQFADYLQWYDREVETEAFQRSEAFWQELLNQATPMVLPFDLTTPEPNSELTYAGARISAQIPAETVLALKARARTWNATLFHTLLGIYAQQMGQFCQTHQVTLGISVTGRPSHLAEHLVGYCSHFIPLYLDAGDQATGEIWVQTAKTTMISALKHQNVPFARMLTQRSSTQNSQVIQATFNLDLELALSGLEDIQTQIMPQPVTSARYAIGLNIIPEGDRLHVDLDYNQDRFLAETMERFLADFIDRLTTLASTI